MQNLEIKVHEVTRVEGHGDIYVRVKDGQVAEARFGIVESPRFFEVMLRGRMYSEAAMITSRICGICAVAHTTASLLATESAFGIIPSRQTSLLRRLAFAGEMIQSHILHTYFLISPDFFGVGSVVPMATTHPEVVKRAFRMKGLANDLCAVVAGRHVHPISMAVNGFMAVPSVSALVAIRDRLIDARADMEETVSLFAGIKMPEFVRETEYVSLASDTYEYIGGTVKSSDGYNFAPLNYRDFIKETVVAHSTAKHVSAKRPQYMVGSLARFNNSSGLLHPKALDAAARLGLSAPNHNPYMITATQVVETVHSIEDAIDIISTLLDEGVRREEVVVAPKAGRGVGMVEAPRGLLIHDYTYGDDGRMIEANCIIPTGQNAANVEADLRAIVPNIMELGPEIVETKLKMLVRAYDPCISCSTHSINIVFEN